MYIVAPDSFADKMIDFQYLPPSPGSFGGDAPWKTKKEGPGYQKGGIKGQGFSNIQVPGINWAEGVLNHVKELMSLVLIYQKTLI